MNVEKKRPILLIVEDEVIQAMAQRANLESIGYHVVMTNTGEKAVELLNKNCAVDLILMDIDLGKGIDGITAAEIILKSCNIPIVFFSSHTEREIIEKTEKIIFYGYVVKSSSTTVLDATIKMALKLFNLK